MNNPGPGKLTSGNLPSLKHCVRVIAFHGFKSAGKTTAADYVISRKFMGQDWENHTFAKELKACVSHIFGFTEFQMEYAKEEVDENWGITPRYALQKIGTEIIRDQLGKILGIGDSSTHWVTRLYQKINDQVNKYSHNEKYPLYVVIGDLRFPNEAEALVKYFNTRIVYVKNPLLESANADKAGSLHASEASIGTFPVHFVVENNGINKSVFQNEILQTIYKLNFNVDQEAKIIPRQQTLINLY